jgi:hypothetical protein
MKKALHADMQLSTRSNDFWSAHLYFAKDDLTQSYIFKQKLQNCKPIDLSRFVIPSGRDTWSTGHLILKLTRENTTANALLLITNGVLFLQQGLWSLIRLTNKYMFLNLPRDVSRSTACFRLRAHNLRFETATWNQINLPTCDLFATADVQDEQHVLFHCANPQMSSLRRKDAPLFPPTGASPRCVYFLKPEQ